jgi:hypothetical protein
MLKNYTIENPGLWMDLGFFLFVKKLGIKNYFFAKTQRKTPPIVEIKSNEYVSRDWTDVLII